jgi:hypothetical protein
MFQEYASHMDLKDKHLTSTGLFFSYVT